MTYRFEIIKQVELIVPKYPAFFQCFIDIKTFTKVTFLFRYLDIIDTALMQLFYLVYQFPHLSVHIILIFDPLNIMLYHLLINDVAGSARQITTLTSGVTSFGSSY